MFNRLKKTTTRRKRRILRVRRPLKQSKHPRLTVTKTNMHLYAQIIDDEQSKTLVGLGTMSKEFRGSEHAKKTKASAKEIGKKLAEFALKHNIKHVVFDRGRFKYHGIIAELASGAREGGLQF